MSWQFASPGVELSYLTASPWGYEQQRIEAFSKAGAPSPTKWNGRSELIFYRF